MVFCRAGDPSPEPAPLAGIPNVAPDGILVPIPSCTLKFIDFVPIQLDPRPCLAVWVSGLENVLIAKALGTALQRPLARHGCGRLAKLFVPSTQNRESVKRHSGCPLVALEEGWGKVSVV